MNSIKTYMTEHAVTNTLQIQPNESGIWYQTVGRRSQGITRCIVLQGDHF